MTVTPQDHESATFTHTFPSGKTVTLPRFKAVLTFGRARKMRKLPDEEQMFALMEEVCDDATLDVLDEAGLDEMAGLFEAWQADSGVSLGESEGSSN